MGQIFLITFPFFALILCGYAATRRGLLPLNAIPGLNAYVLYFGLPCMLYRFAANLKISELFDIHAIVVYLICAVVVVGLTIATTLGKRNGWNDAAFGALVAAFPNSGFMGMPMIVSLFGPDKVGPVVVSISVDMIITSSVCIALSRLGSKDGNVLQTVGRVLKGVAVNPLPWAVTLGAVASAYSITLYGPLDDVVRMFAQSCSPIALFTIGAMLARPPAGKQAGHSRLLESGWLRLDVNLIVVYKLLLHPALVFGVGWAYTHMGFALSPEVLTMLIITATLPSASSITVLAERYGADSQRIAQIVLISTVFAFITFSVAVKYLR